MGLNSYYNEDMLFLPLVILEKNILKIESKTYIVTLFVDSTKL